MLCERRGEFSVGLSTPGGGKLGLVVVVVVELGSQWALVDDQVPLMHVFLDLMTLTNLLEKDMGSYCAEVMSSFFFFFFFFVFFFFFFSFFFFFF